MTLGETPGNTTLRITYRVGGGIKSNVPAWSLTTPINLASKYLSAATTTVQVDNLEPAYGGNERETIEEIRHKTKQVFASQNRCVTKEDYEARILSMPPRLGSIAKVFAKRTGIDKLGNRVDQMIQNLNFDASAGFTQGDVDALQTLIDNNASATEFQTAVTGLQSFYTSYQNILSDVGTSELSTIDLYVLAYDDNKNLTYLPSAGGDVTHPIKNNIKEYLSNYRMITDQINIRDGKIINFGVAFEIVSHRSSNKADVKLRCIDKITEYFDIDRLQFRQPIYTSDLEYELMGLEGVRAVNWIQLTQDFLNLEGVSLDGMPDELDPLYDYNSANSNLDSPMHYGGMYGWEYNFNGFYDSNNAYYVSKGVVLPPVEPAVFELKNPKQNIRGVVL